MLTISDTLRILHATSKHYIPPVTLIFRSPHLMTLQSKSFRSDASHEKVKSIDKLGLKCICHEV